MQNRCGSESDRAWEFCSLRFYKGAMSQYNYWAEAHNSAYKFIVSAVDSVPRFLTLVQSFPSIHRYKCLWPHGSD